MPRFDHDSKMYRFPSFHETYSCEQSKTAQDSLRDILAKWPSASSQSSSGTASPPRSSSSSAASSPPPPPAPLPSAAPQPKRPSNASDYKWINTCPRSSASSASSKSSSGSDRNRKSSLGSNGGRKSPTSRSSSDSRRGG